MLRTHSLFWSDVYCFVYAEASPLPQSLNRSNQPATADLRSECFETKRELSEILKIALSIASQIAKPLSRAPPDQSPSQMEQSNEPKESTDYVEHELINHSNLVLSNLESLYLNDEFSDITLVIENSEIPAHKVILASSSDYFRALLFCGLQESQSAKISLKCSNEQLFKQLLKYVYTGKMNLTEMSVQQILEIFQMSHEYNFRALNETISKHLISILSLKNVCIFYDLSNFYEIDELRTACLHFLDHNAEQALKQENFLRLSKTNLKSILLRESFCANELSILVALNRWIKANPEEDGKVLYQHIRMNLIDLEQLIELIRSTELLNPDEILDLIYSTVKNKVLVEFSSILID